MILDVVMRLASIRFRDDIGFAPMAKTVTLSADWDHHELVKFHAGDNSEQSRTWLSVSHAHKIWMKYFCISELKVSYD